MNSSTNEPQNEQWSDEIIAAMDESDVVDAIDAGFEEVEINLLNELGNRAVCLNLISGHGFHKGQYELLENGQFLLMPPLKAQEYLENLLATAEATA